VITLNATSLLDALHLLFTAAPPPPVARRMSVLDEAHRVALRERIAEQQEAFPTGLPGGGA
jgi:hypothetical protein